MHSRVVEGFSASGASQNKHHRPSHSGRYWYVSLLGSGCGQRGAARAGAVAGAGAHVRSVHAGCVAGSGGVLVGWGSVGR